MHRMTRMATAFLRIVATFGLLVLFIFIAWTTLFISARYTRGLADNSVYSLLDPTDNTTWKSPARLLVAATNGSFYLNGRQKRLISGEFHYFRVHPSQWDDRLRRMRTAGLNTVTTRVPWNFHERRQSSFQFRGKWNLENFIRLVQRLGFLLIVHVGPYIDADWEFGGLPSWLLRDRHMMVRTSNYPPFVQYVTRYFTHLLPVIERKTYRKHGPVIAVQIENEFGSYGHEDPDYLRLLVELIRSHGIQELILTADRGPHLRDGAVAGVLATVTCRGTADDVVSALSHLSAHQPGLPRLVTLFDSNSTSRWGEVVARHPAMSVAEFRRSVDVILSSGASVNVYAFAGGTNFALWSGAVEDTGVDSTSVNVLRQVVRYRGRSRHRRLRQHHSVELGVVNQTSETADQPAGLVYRPVTTAYNCHSPSIISQSGDNQLSLKYHAFRRLLLDRRLISRLQTVPADHITSAIGVVRLDHQLGWDSLLDAIPSSPIVLDSPVFMEQLNTRLGSGQDHGWIVYRTRIPSDVTRVNISGTMRDRAQLFIDGRHVETVYNNKLLPYSVTTTLRHSHRRTRNSSSTGLVLDLVVENMGRSSFGLLDDQRKGFEGPVMVDGRSVDSHWEHFSLDFSGDFLTAMKRCTAWLPTTRSSTTVRGQPTLYRGHFKVKQVRDTYVDMSKWTKGLVVINGFVLGRYWNIGPQQSLYVPAPVISHGSNELLVFELERTLNAKVKFVGKTSWDHHKHRS